MAVYQSEFPGATIDARLAAVATMQTAISNLESAVAAKYSKPSSGIPETDLDADVNAALAKANSAIQSLADYYTKTEVDALFAAVNSLDFVDVSTLPTAGAGTMGKIYLLGPDASGYYAYYYTSYDGTSYSWVGPLGTTEISLSNYATKAELGQLDQKVDDISTGKYYGYYSSSSNLPDDAAVDGFAYVGSGPTYTIYNCEDGVWSSSGITVNQSPIGNGEDIDQDSAGKLQFANRTYDSLNPDGLGYVILRKDATFASQVTATNTIYEIRYNFDLDGGSVTIPAGCTLQFNGGQVVNGTITGNATRIEAGDVQIFSSAIRKYKGYTINTSFGEAVKLEGFDTTLAGTWDVAVVKKEWFGLFADNSGRDCSHIINNIFILETGWVQKHLPQGVYGLHDFLTISDDFDGDGSVFVACDFDDVYDGSIPLPDGATALNSTSYPKGLISKYGYVRCASGLQKDITIENFKIDGGNITPADLPLVNWGIYGLYYSQNHPDASVTIKNVEFSNALQCFAYPAIEGHDIFVNCRFVGCGEHCLYTRQRVGSLTVKDCLFESWGNKSGYSNTGIKDCHAIKFPSDTSRTTDVPLTIDNCVFNKGNALSAYVVNLMTDQIYISNSVFDIQSGYVSNNKDNSNSIAIFRNCKYPPFNGATVSASIPITRIEIYDSICSSENLTDACYLENCDVDKLYYGNASDKRQYGVASLATLIRKFKAFRCRFNLFSVDNSGRYLLYGCSEAVFKNCEFYVSDSNTVNESSMFLNKGSLSSSTVVFDGCTYDKGKQKNGISASTCDIVLNNSTFRCSKSVDYGYVNRAPIFNAANSITINNTFCVADTTGFIAPLFINTITNVTYQSVTLGTSADYYAAFKGQMRYDASLNKYVFWNGSAWVNMDGSALS